MKIHELATLQINLHEETNTISINQVVELFVTTAENAQQTINWGDGGTNTFMIKVYNHLRFVNDINLFVNRKDKLTSIILYADVAKVAFT